MYKEAQQVSIYLGTDKEVDTMPIIKDLFKSGKEVPYSVSWLIVSDIWPHIFQIFVPTYRKDVMEMVQLYSIDDYDTLPLTKWNIKQPDIDEKRPNAMETGTFSFLICHKRHLF